MVGLAREGRVVHAKAAQHFEGDAAHRHHGAKGHAAAQERRSGRAGAKLLRAIVQNRGDVYVADRNAGLTRHAERRRHVADPLKVATFLFVRRKKCVKQLDQQHRPSGWGTYRAACFRKGGQAAEEFGQGAGERRPAAFYGINAGNAGKGRRVTGRQGVPEEGARCRSSRYCR